VFESGLSVIAHASWLLPKEIGIVIVTDNVRDLKFNSENSFILEGHQDSKTLAYLYRNSMAAIGQISDSKRIINTIPHKAYEAAYFSKPYIAMWNSAIFELFTREALFSLKYPTADNLAEIMKQIHQFPDDAKERGLLFGQEYQSRYRQVKLQKEFFEIISPLN
jgi:hypothetical protein